MDIGLSTQPAKLGLVIHNNPAHKPHNRARHAVKSGQVIAQGQVCSVVKGASSLEWVRGFIAGGGADQTQRELLYIAAQASSASDVQTSGALTGLSSAGGFEISTAYFDAGKTYQAGDLLVPDGITGNLIPVPADSSGFTVDPEADTDTFIMARVVHDFAPPVDFGAVYTPNDTVDGKSSQGVTGGTFRIGRRSGAASLTMLRIELLAPRPVTVAAAA